jgi:hypothetical protein
MSRRPGKTRGAVIHGNAIRSRSNPQRSNAAAATRRSASCSI